MPAISLISEGYSRQVQEKKENSINIYMLWFNFILGSYLLFFLFLGMVMHDNNMIMSLKQKKRRFEPRIKLNHNIYIN